jgi:hypothetical protein
MTMKLLALSIWLAFYSISICVVAQAAVIQARANDLDRAMGNN